MQDKTLPIVGLSGNFDAGKNESKLAMAYVNAVAQAGASPVVLPAWEAGEAAIDRMLDTLDALVLTGGSDFTEACLGEPLHPSVTSLNPLRDAFEMPLVRRALSRQMPILGICRGHQLLNLAMGGDLYQDLPSQWEGEGLCRHDQDVGRDQTIHKALIQEDTLLASLFKEAEIPVNSFHHQAVRRPAPGLRVSARSEDGVVEAVESAHGKPVLGVQWHPECLTATRPAQQALFRWLVGEARLYRAARTVQQTAVSVDAHCDAPMFFSGRYDLLEGGGTQRGNIDFDAQGDERLEWVPSRVDLRRMELGQQDAVVMAAYLKQLSRDDDAIAEATAKARRLLDEVREKVAQYPERVALARTPEQVIRLKREGKRAVLLGVENAYALGRNLDLVEEFARRGVVYITLCHNGHNDVCDSASRQQEPEHNGLSAFGRRVVAEMNDWGIMVDMSHASEKSFYDAVDCSRAPIITSHSSAWALCPHRRNLNDEQLRLLARQGGMTGICLYDGFLAQDRDATLADILAHIRYVSDLVGVDYVGIGSDFDGGGGIAGCNDQAELFNITRALLRDGFTPDEVSGIVGGNFLRVMGRVQALATKHL